MPVDGFRLGLLSVISVLLLFSIVGTLWFVKSKKPSSSSFALPSSSPPSLRREEITIVDHSQSHCQTTTMEEEQQPQLTADVALSNAKTLIPTALENARAASGFSARWKAIISKLDRLPVSLTDLSTHPCFPKNPLCVELLQSISSTLTEAIQLAESRSVGKLQMQSDLDALAGKLDLNLRDCSLLIKTGVLCEDATAASKPTETDSGRNRIRELLARLQIGHIEAKQRAIEGLIEAIMEDEKLTLEAIGRTNISSLIQLLSAATPVKPREKVAALICSLAESGSCENLLISEGVLPALIRLAESGTTYSREKAVVCLQRLSMSADTARSIVGHGGICPLVEICQIGSDSISQLAAAGTLKNLSAVPEVRQNLADEGIIKVMINLLDCGIALGSKEYAAECLQNLTASNESLRRCTVTEGGIKSLLAYLDGPLPQEPAVGALRNLISSTSTPIDNSIIFPCLVHVLKDGSIGAQQAATSIICIVSRSSMEVKRLVGELGCIPLLLQLLVSKSNSAREVATQAIANLMSCAQNCREVKKVDEAVPNLVQLLDPCAQNTAKKYAVSCLLMLSTSKRSRKLMGSYGAVGYLKKLSEMDVPGAKKLVDRLERGKLRSLFSRK